MAFCRKIAQSGVMAKSCRKAKPLKLSLRSLSNWPALGPSVANSITRMVLRGPLLTPKLTMRGAPW